MKNQEVEGFVMIPSEPKEPGWRRFLAVMPRLLEKPYSTKQLMRILHGLVTTGVELPPYPEHVQRDMRANLLISGRSDVDNIIHEIRQAITNHRASSPLEALEKRIVPIPPTGWFGIIKFMVKQTRFYRTRVI